MRVAWVLLRVLGMLTLCWGFTVDRSSATGSEQIGQFEKIATEKFLFTGMEPVLQGVEVKKSMKPEEEMADDPFREKRSELLVLENQPDNKTKGLEEIKDEILFPVEENSFSFLKENENEKPHNVVLLFIDESGQEQVELWKSLKTSNNFPVHGYLQNCRNEGNLLRLSLDEALVSGTNYQCECEYFLRANLASLFVWAHRAKEMSTGSVTAMNFSIPNDSPTFNKNSEESEEDKMKMFKPQLHDEWHLIDLDRSGMSSVSPSVASTPKSEKEGMWDVFDTFSKIRIAFFRNWLDSFHKNIMKTKDEFSSRKSVPFEANLVELMGDTVEKLKSLSSAKGFIMVAVAPGNKITSAIDILQSEISPKDTLLVVSGICSKDKKLVPFFANGPGARYLLEAKTIWELPAAVKKAVSGCQGSWCTVESLNPIWSADHEFHKRFARNNSTDKEANPTTLTTITTPQETNPTTLATNTIAKEANPTTLATNTTAKEANPTTLATNTTAKEANATTLATNTTTKDSKDPEVIVEKSTFDNDKTEKPKEKNHHTHKKPVEGENLTNVEIQKRIDESLPSISNSGDSRFLLETTTAIIGTIASFAATIFLDF